MVAIEAAGLIRRFRDGVEAVRGVDIEVQQGEIFGFLGPNGAGKTTTVRMLTTLLPLSGGSAQVAGADVVREPAMVRARIGVALQEIGLDPLQTGRELLELQCGLYRLPREHRAMRAGELLELVGLVDAADRRVGTYSGGMKRRLDLASALVHAPQVLFLDEPTTGLDPASRITIWEEVRRINSAGTTVFLTTQYMEEADQLAGRIAIIDGGRVVAEGTPDELKARLGHDVVTVELQDSDVEPGWARAAGLEGVAHVTATGRGIAVYVDNGAGAVAGLVRALEDAALVVRSVSVARPTLDDVFLEATGRRLEGGTSG
ncbi:MAG: ATP-binding cassette domain-containing protein [Mycobacteriales bacterium]